MPVRLNVGGTLFVTTLDTLLSQGDNMLSAMVKHPNPAKEIDGALFIDRDPTVFQWILNYLRGSSILPPKHTPEMFFLREEALYFGIDGLLTRIQHVLYPNFEKGDFISVRGSKFTIHSIEQSGYVVLRGTKKKFKLSLTENVEKTTIELGDEVVAWHKPSFKRIPGIVMGIEGKRYTIQFDGDLGQAECDKSGVRF